MTAPKIDNQQMWRTFAGAEYGSVREIPCFVISNGYLIDAAGESVNESEPTIAAEIQRRGHAYLDHGYGVGHDLVPVMGCDHRAAV